MRLRTKVVSYIVMMMNDATSGGLIGRSIVEGDKVCANSLHVAETVRQRFGVEGGTLYDGVDSRLYFPGNHNTNNRPVVLYAGSFQPRKRVELVIEEAARHPNVEFRLAGKGETQQACRALVERHGCRNVQFLGHLSSADLAEQMRLADIFLFPSVLEGHPQVLLQAAASGLPVIAMELYRPDFVRDGLTGFLVRSDEQLAARLDLLLVDAGLRQAMSAQAVQHAAGFNWDRIAGQWACLFERVARGKSPSLFHRAAAA